MEDKNENMSADDMHINIIKKDDNEVLFDSDCCSCMTLVLTSDGRLATSFFGLHTPELVKVLKKTINQYYAKLYKEFKHQYKAEKARIKGIKLVKGQNPELDDETLDKLAQELRDMQIKEEAQDAAQKAEIFANGEEVHDLNRPKTTKSTGAKKQTSSNATSPARQSSSAKSKADTNKKQTTKKQ
jgi:ribosomal protein L16 Arg81 hydroxylase